MAVAPHEFKLAQPAALLEALMSSLEGPAPAILAACHQAMSNVLLQTAGFRTSWHPFPFYFSKLHSQFSTLALPSTDFTFYFA